MAAGYHRWNSPREEEKTVILPFQMYTHTLYETKCAACQKKNVLEPVFIPPTWFKSCRKEGIQNVWRQAIEEFSTARQIVIIGYSLPATDTFLPYLLTLGLTRNADLYRVIVVNTDSSEILQERYKRMFSRSLVERGRLVFREMPFARFVDKEMDRISEGTTG